MMSHEVAASRVTALSVEFVAKPQEAARVEATIPKAITGSLQDVTGFAGCLVMISDQETRLVTVVTLWAGEDRAKRCRENARWVHALLAPYVDRCLRVQTLIACLPALATAGPCLIEQGPSAEETVCVA
jgi:hypothetical protein